MNSEPCVKFGIRISPKIREKPADSRNSSPPKVTLLTDSTSQKVIVAVVPPSSCQKSAAGACKAPAARLASGFDRRKVARINRLLEELLLVVRPELAHVVVGFYGFVPQAQTVLGALFAQLPDVEVANHVAEMIEL